MGSMERWGLGRGMGAPNMEANSINGRHDSRSSDQNWVSLLIPPACQRVIIC